MAQEKSHKWDFLPLDLNWERGRENGSFPVVEVLKPQGVRKFRLRNFVQLPEVAPKNSGIAGILISKFEFRILKHQEFE